MSVNPIALTHIIRKVSFINIAILVDQLSLPRSVPVDKFAFI
jgi:hypothetical protein